MFSHADRPCSSPRQKAANVGHTRSSSTSRAISFSKDSVAVGTGGSRRGTSRGASTGSRHQIKQGSRSADTIQRYASPRKNHAAAHEKVVVAARRETQDSSHPNTPCISRRTTTASITSDDLDAATCIKVCVRVRPLSESELQNGESDVARCEGECGTTLQMVPPFGHEHPDQGTYCFDWVLSEQASQQQVYELLGQPVVLGVADGFHGCVFAHGQTGSGKSHTIFGGALQDAEGLLPRIGRGLFEKLQGGQAEHIVRLSYLEIYNEKLRDLLQLRVDSDGFFKELHVRKHPRFGVFVEGLTSNVVQSSDDVTRLLRFGHKIRAVARTNMNAASSRSHAVVSLHVELGFCEGASDEGKIVRRYAQLNVVDLAGSERLGAHEVRKSTERESRQINKSLWALSLIISRLAAQERSHGRDHRHIPYRDSKLTHILSDSLMGNCRTAMLACVSPASSAYGISMSTLRFAMSAKKIRTRPVKNEDLEVALVESLRAEIESLRQQVELSKVGAEQKTALCEQLATTQMFHEELMQPMTSWANRKAEAEHFDRERDMTLESLGVRSRSVAQLWKQGVNSLADVVNKDTDPYLVNLCNDPLLSGCLTYALPKGEVVCVGSDPSCKIQLEGLGVQPETCRLVCDDGKSVQVHVGRAGEEMLSTSPDEDGGSKRRFSFTKARRGSALFKSGIGQVFVNNKIVGKSSYLHHGDRLRFGHTHVFQLFIPRAHDDRRSSVTLASSLDLVSVNEKILAGEYAHHLKERLGPVRAQHVFNQLQELRQLVDEANVLTEELRGGRQRIIFKAQILSDVTSAENDAGLAVTFTWQSAKSIDATDGSGDALEDVSVVWSESKFRQRLEVMRDLHHDVEDRDLPWGMATDLDPWRDDVGVLPLGAPASPASPGRQRDGSGASDNDVEGRGVASESARWASTQAELQQMRLRLAEVEAAFLQTESRAVASEAAASTAKDAQMKAETILSAVEQELQKTAAERDRESRQVAVIKSERDALAKIVSTRHIAYIEDGRHLALDASLGSTAVQRVRRTEVNGPHRTPVDGKPRQLTWTPTLGSGSLDYQSTKTVVATVERQATTPARRLSPSRVLTPKRLSHSAEPQRRRSSAKTELRQLLQGELTNIRQEIQTLSDLCENLDTGSNSKAFEV